MVAAVIADIVGSRSLSDRSDAQRTLDEQILRVQRDFPTATQLLRPTVGDELQGVYGRVEDAITAILLLQLALPEHIECRFGIGIGDIIEISSASGGIPEGPGWWAAREAIVAVHAKQQRAVPSARSWIVVGQEHDGGMSQVVEALNAYLLMRDQQVSTISERGRRLTYGRCVGMTQKQLAGAEGITQSAVSQALGIAGAGAIVAGLAALGVTLPRRRPADEPGTGKVGTGKVGTRKVGTPTDGAVADSAPADGAATAERHHP